MALLVLAPVSHLIMAGRWNFLVLLGRFSLASELFSYDFPPAEWRVPICKEVKAASAKAKEQEDEVKSRPMRFSFFYKARGLQRNNTMAQLPPAAVYENCRLSPLRAAKYMPSLWRPLSRESFSSNPVETITAALRNTSSACCRRSRFAPSSSRGGLQAQELLASRGYCVPECSV